MTPEPMATEFAPAERDSEARLRDLTAVVGSIPLLQEVFDAVPESLIVLNDKRQIVVANRSFRALVGAGDNGSLLGLRPGEAVNCIHAYKTEGGCGTTEFCGMCGAVEAILSSRGGEPAVRECRISCEPVGTSLDLRVTATPFSVGSEDLTIVVAEDISNAKRRAALERAFFHDILDTAGGLKGLADLLELVEGGEADDVKGMISRQSEILIEEIGAHRELLAAENDALAVDVVALDATELLQSVVDLYRNHEVATDRQIAIDPGSEQITIHSDRALLSRVLGNMVKNGLEAVAPGQSVTVGCRSVDDDVLLWVHNPTFMPRDVQLQVFQRSFSTKGSGRGIGTYSIKLLGERYLDGKVDFRSSEQEGTTFEIRLP